MVNDLEGRIDFLQSEFTELKELTIERIEKFCARLAVLEQACVGAAMDRKESYTSTFAGVDSLELSIRPLNVLRAMGIETLGHLIHMKRTDLLKGRNCGRKTVSEIEFKLKQRGLALRESP